jgi:cytochrome c553
MESRVPRTEAIQKAVSTIKALREITRQTGTITKRAQSKILQALTDEEMTAVAELLTSQPEASHA